MNVFDKAFKRSRNENFRRRTFANGLEGLEKYPYLIYYQTAVKDYQNRNLTSALNNIDATIQKADIDDWKHYAFKANILEDLQKYSEAIKNYEKAIEISQTDINVYALYHQIGFCYISQNQNEKAIEFYSYAIELKKNHPNSQFNPDEEGMDMGVLLGVTLKKMYVNRSVSLTNIGKLNEALQDCVESINIDKNYSNPYLQLGFIYFKAGQEDEAVKYISQAGSLGNQKAMQMLKQLGY